MVVGVCGSRSFRAHCIGCSFSGKGVAAMGIRWRTSRWDLFLRRLGRTSDLALHFAISFIRPGAFGASGNVALIESNVTLSFDASEANFAPSVKASGMCGRLHVAKPLDTCSPLTNKIERKFELESNKLAGLDHEIRSNVEK